MNTNIKYSCPVEAALGMIGGKYKSVILYHLKNETLRYSELKKILVNATSKMLTQQLRELEADGIVQRTVYPVVPPKTEYSLTEFGKTLIPVIDAICEWGTEYLWDTENNCLRLREESNVQTDEEI